MKKMKHIHFICLILALSFALSGCISLNKSDPTTNGLDAFEKPIEINLDSIYETLRTGYRNVVDSQSLVMKIDYEGSRIYSGALSEYSGDISGRFLQSTEGFLGSVLWQDSGHYHDSGKAQYFYENDRRHEWMNENYEYQMAYGYDLESVCFTDWVNRMTGIANFPQFLKDLSSETDHLLNNQGKIITYAGDYLSVAKLCLGVNYDEWFDGECKGKKITSAEGKSTISLTIDTNGYLTGVQMYIIYTMDGTEFSSSVNVTLSGFDTVSAISAPSWVTPIPQAPQILILDENPVIRGEGAIPLSQLVTIDYEDSVTVTTLNGSEILMIREDEFGNIYLVGNNYGVDLVTVYANNTYGESSITIEVQFLPD